MKGTSIDLPVLVGLGDRPALDPALVGLTLVRFVLRESTYPAFAAALARLAPRADTSA